MPPGAPIDPSDTARPARAAQATRGRFFGRARERATLTRLLDAARGGHGQIVLLGGEAGIGKAALIEDLGVDAEAAGRLVLTGHCYDLSTTPPYGPWLEIVRASPRVEGLASLSEILRHGAEHDATPRSVSDLLAWALELITALARRAPLVLVLDDLHWADEASLDALRRALRRIARELQELPRCPTAASWRSPPPPTPRSTCRAGASRRSSTRSCRRFAPCQHLLPVSPRCGSSRCRASSRARPGRGCRARPGRPAR